MHATQHNIALFGIVLVALLILVWILSWLIYYVRRTVSLRERGYFLACTKQRPAIYEVQIGGELVALPIPTTPRDELGVFHVVVPSQAEWQRSAPDWAKNKRDEIFTRVIAGVPKGWVKFPDDWMA